MNVLKNRGKYIIAALLLGVLVFPSTAVTEAQPAWQECNITGKNFNVEACRRRAEQFKGKKGPLGQLDEAWFSWALTAPYPLSREIACALAPKSVDCKQAGSGTCKNPSTKLPVYIYGRGSGSTWKGQPPVPCHNEHVAAAGTYELLIDGFQGKEDDRYIEVYVNNEMVAKVDDPTPGIPDNPAKEGGTARVKVTARANSNIRVCSPNKPRTVKGKGTIDGESVVWVSLRCAIDDNNTPPKSTPTKAAQPTQIPPGDGGGGTGAQGVGFQFAPSEQIKKVGETFTVQVDISTQSEQVFGAESHVMYDNSILSLTRVTEGDFFPSTITTNNSGNSAIRGMVVEPADYRTGGGRLATLEFTALKNGQTTVTFYCEPGKFNSSKIIKNDINASNIINCADNNTLAVQVGDGTSISPTSADQPQPTQKPKPSNNARAKVLAALIVMIFMLFAILMGI